MMECTFKTLPPFHRHMFEQHSITGKWSAWLLLLTQSDIWEAFTVLYQRTQHVHDLSVALVTCQHLSRNPWQMWASSWAWGAKSPQGHFGTSSEEHGPAMNVQSFLNDTFKLSISNLIKIHVPNDPKCSLPGPKSQLDCESQYSAWSLNVCVPVPGCCNIDRFRQSLAAASGLGWL